MTREELERIKSDYYAGVPLLGDLHPLWSALEVAWAEQAEWSRRAYAAEKVSETWGQWAYKLGLKLDRFTPAFGIDNRIRIEEAVNALEGMQAERDVSAMELEATISERDESIMAGLALTVEKDGLQLVVDELRKGHDRYEIARRLTPAQWADVWKLNISTGKPLDEIIDDLQPFVISGGENLKGCEGTD